MDLREVMFETEATLIRFRTGSMADFSESFEFFKSGKFISISGYRLIKGDPIPGSNLKQADNSPLQFHPSYEFVGLTSLQLLQYLRSVLPTCRL
jgi:hypothetical protein